MAAKAPEKINLDFNLKAGFSAEDLKSALSNEHIQKLNEHLDATRSTVTFTANKQWPQPPA